jgi:hypothetical protein
MARRLYVHTHVPARGQLVALQQFDLVHNLQTLGNVGLLVQQWPLTCSSVDHKLCSRCNHAICAGINRFRMGRIWSEDQLTTPHSSGGRDVAQLSVHVTLYGTNRRLHLESTSYPGPSIELAKLLTECLDPNSQPPSFEM